MCNFPTQSSSFLFPRQPPLNLVSSPHLEVHQTFLHLINSTIILPSLPWLYRSLDLTLSKTNMYKFPRSRAKTSSRVLFLLLQLHWFGHDKNPKLAFITPWVHGLHPFPLHFSFFPPTLRHSANTKILVIILYTKFGSLGRFLTTPIPLYSLDNETVYESSI